MGKKTVREIVKHVRITCWSTKPAKFTVDIHKQLMVNGKKKGREIVKSYDNVSENVRSYITSIAWLGAQIGSVGTHFAGNYPSMWFDVIKKVKG